MLNDVEPQALIDALAQELAKNPAMKMPEWALFVKTGMHRERVPARTDWWYVRAASMLRTIAIRGPVGVSRLRVKYGGRKNRGYQPDAFKEAGGKIIRTILQQLERGKLVKQDTRGLHKGRVLTSDGHKLINSISKQVGA